MIRTLILLCIILVVAILTWVWVQPVPADSALKQSSSTNLTPLSVADRDLRTQIANEMQTFNNWRGSAAQQARQRIAARGDAAVPVVMAVLGQTTTAAQQFYESKETVDQTFFKQQLMRQNHLIATLGVIGGDAGRDALLLFAPQLNSNSPLHGVIYATVDQLGESERANQYAADVIRASNSDGNRLTVALSRFWPNLPDALSPHIAQHYAARDPQARALAYMTGARTDSADQLTAQLTAAVAAMGIGDPGNKHMLIALAEREDKDAFLVRLEGLELRSSVRKTATLYSQFRAADDPTKIDMISRMIRANDSELMIQALVYLLDTQRDDLLHQHRLIYVPNNPVAAYDQYIPGFSGMKREQRSAYLNDEELDKLEAVESQLSPIVFGPGVDSVVKRLGYRVTATGSKISINRANP